MKNRYTIDEPIILIDYLTQVLDKSHKKAKTLLTKGAIYVNGQNITKYNYPLLPGYTIEIKEFNKNDMDSRVGIIYEDKYIIVVNKPYGMLTISTETEKEKTLYHLVSNYVKVKNKNARIFVIHRLDRETSGLIVFAKNEKIKNLYQENWNDLAIYRGYVAVVEGKPEVKMRKIVSYLAENRHMKVYSTSPNNGKKAITNYKVIKTKGNYSLLDINLETGRKNQIRVAMQDMKTPIAGDQKYGAKTDPVKRLCLHSHKLILRNPINKTRMEFKTDMPEFIKKIC